MGGKELKDYIKVYDGVLDGKKCRQIIRTFDLDLENQERIDRERRPTFTELNFTKQYLDKNPRWTGVQKLVQDVFINYTNQYIQELDLGADFPPKYAFEQYRIKKYTKLVDEFKDHVDVADYNSARRFLVCFLYLNTVRSGGETDFPRLGHSVSPVEGRMLIFPSLWLYRHAGRPVKDKAKYILGSYLHYL